MNICRTGVPNNSHEEQNYSLLLNRKRRAHEVSSVQTRAAQTVHPSVEHVTRQFGLLLVDEAFEQSGSPSSP